MSRSGFVYTIEPLEHAFLLVLRNADPPVGDRDLDDPACTSASDNTEDDGLLGNACNDGLDNDADGLKEFAIALEVFDRGASFPHFEAMLQAGHPGKNLVVRTLAWSADEVDLMPRPKNFGDLHQHLTAQKADVIIGCSSASTWRAVVPVVAGRLRVTLAGGDVFAVRT